MVRTTTNSSGWIQNRVQYSEHSKPGGATHDGLRIVANVTGAVSRVHQAFAMDYYSSLTVNGVDAEFVALATMYVYAADLFALSGGILRLPNLTTYSGVGAGGPRYFEARGAGSRLELLGLSTIETASGFEVTARDGGIVDLPNARLASEGTLS